MSSLKQSLVLIALIASGSISGLRSEDQEPKLPDFQLQPLITRYARTATKYTLQTGVRYFENMELQEADHFDGYTVEAELTLPFLKRFQLRLYYSAYTDGDARLTDEGNPAQGQDIDIDGDGGVFDFPSAILDYEILKPESSKDWSLAAYGGMGSVFESLDTSADDVFNHRGRVALFGLKADKALTNRLTGLANLGARYYYESDDIHPKDDSEDVFWFMDASAAIVYDARWRWLYPAMELVYQGDLGSYNTLEAVPQFIIPFCSNFEMKAGAGFALTSDGERWQARLQAVLRY